MVARCRFRCLWDGERIAPPIVSKKQALSGERIAPPIVSTVLQALSAAMACGMVPVTAFVVNLPLLDRGTTRYDVLVADMGTEVRPCGMDTFLAAVRRAQLRNLPE